MRGLETLAPQIRSWVALASYDLLVLLHTQEVCTDIDTSVGCGDRGSMIVSGEMLLEPPVESNLRLYRQIMEGAIGFIRSFPFQAIYSSW